MVPPLCDEAVVDGDDPDERGVAEDTFGQPRASSRHLYDDDSRVLSAEDSKVAHLPVRDMVGKGAHVRGDLVSPTECGGPAIRKRLFS